ncbi:MAG TPA: DEAD/DEAH box helicase [Ktedonobacterales bacterium]
MTDTTQAGQTAEPDATAGQSGAPTPEGPAVPQQTEPAGQAPGAEQAMEQQAAAPEHKAQAAEQAQSSPQAPAPAQAATQERPQAPQQAAEPSGREAFAALGLGEPVLRVVEELGFGPPTPIQRQAIPVLLSGRDVLAQAPTGSGKTAAFGLPIVERLEEGELAPQALIVAPTRELAIQVAEALHTFGKYRELVTLPIYGGAPYDRQLRALKRGVQVVVGTPGRLLDHLNRGTLDLSHIRTVVLDEADEMLNMGFIEDIEAILAALPEQRQTAFFSATIPTRIARLAEQFLREPGHVRVAEREAVAPQVRQVYYEVPASAKPEALARILDLEQPESAIIFVRTRRDADEVSERLNGMGYIAQAIHGEISQAQRERTLERFRKGHTQLLVATDVAARGLDIHDVSHVINYDLPLDAESYVHRIGRTGHQPGTTGEALTLVTPRERRMLIQIERAIRRRLERLRLPSAADVAVRRRTAFRDDVLTILESGQLDPFLGLVEELSGTHDPAELAAAAFKMAAQERQAARPGRPSPWAVPSEEVPEIPEPELRPVAGPRSRERERTPRRTQQPEETVRLVLRVGRREGVRPADLVGAVANEAGLPGEAVGDIDIYDTFSFVEVPADQAEHIRAALNATTVRGRAPRAALAGPEEAQLAMRSRRERPGPAGRGGRPTPYWVTGRGRAGEPRANRGGFARRGPGRLTRGRRER